MSAEVINLAEVRDRRNTRRDISARVRQNVERALELLTQGAPPDRVQPHLKRALTMLELVEFNP